MNKKIRFVLDMLEVWVLCLFYIAIWIPIALVEEIYLAVKKRE